MILAFSLVGLVLLFWIDDVIQSHTTWWTSVTKRHTEKVYGVVVIIPVSVTVFYGSWWEILVMVVVGVAFWLVACLGFLFEEMDKLQRDLDE